MRRVRDILVVKGRDVWSIGPNASVYDAMKLMADKGIGALLVMEGPKLVGIISERDYARKVILQVVLREPLQSRDYDDACCLRGAGAEYRRVYGLNDRDTDPPFAGYRSRRGAWRDFHRRSRQIHHR